MKYLSIVSVCLVLLVQAAIADSLAPDDRLQFADGLFARELFELAAQEYSTLIADHPDHSKSDVAHYRLGDCYRHMGKNSLAERQYAKVFKSYPKSEYRLKAGIKRADIFVKDKRYEEGVALYRLVLKQKPPEPLGSACEFFSAEALMALGKTNDAQQAYAAVAERRLSSDYRPFALLRLADIAVSQGGDIDKVIKLYRSAATNNISTRAAAEALYQIGRIEFGRKRFEESSRAYGELAKRYPNDVRTKGSALDAAWSLFNSGFSAKSLKLADSAIEIEKDKETLAAWLYLKANSERQLKKHDQAIATYTRLLGVGSADSDVYAYERALCYFSKGDYKLVVRDLENRAGNKTIREDMLWLLARSSAAAKDSDSAIQYYTKLYKEYPKGRFADQAMFRVADELRSRRDWKGGAEMYRDVSSRYPEGGVAAKALFAEGVCHINAGNEADAVKAWTSIYEKYPDDELVPESILSRAVAQMKLGLPEEAGLSLDLFLKNYPKAAKIGEAYFWKGVLASQAGENDGAAKMFTRALELGLEGDLLAKARAYAALAVYRGGDLARAAEALQKLKDGVETRNAGRNAFLWLAEYRLENHKADDARSAAQRVLDLSVLPLERQEAFCLLARAYLLKGDGDASRKAYAEAYKLDVASLFKAEAALALGQAGLASENTKAVKEYFASAARLAESNDGLGIRARAYVGLGQFSEQAKDYPSAARYFMSVAVLFDDPAIVPKALDAAARCYGLAGKEVEQKEARDELARRYPKYKPPRGLGE